ncbi:MAG: NADH-quinone oxidoreductase subunit K [Planctomycetota bacterium]
MSELTPATLYLGTAILLILIGLAAVLVRRNLLKMVLGFSLVDTGLHLLIAALGSHPDRVAPILDDEKYLADPSALMLDPIPQALVLTAIVIGVGVTALMLAYVVRLYARRGTLDIGEIGRLKW